MELLQLLSESEAGQGFINENEESILEATAQFHETPQQIKDYIIENLEDFIVPGDVPATYNKMVDFVTNQVVGNLHELADVLSN